MQPDNKHIKIFTHLGKSKGLTKSQIKKYRARFGDNVDKQSRQWISDKYPEIYKYLCSKQCDMFLQTRCKVLQYPLLYSFLFPEKSPGRCLGCGKKTEWGAHRRSFKEFCSIPCMNSSSEIQNRRKETSIKNYGVPYTFQAQENIDKREKTYMKKYGSHTPMHSKKVVSKQRKTNMKKYGVPHPSILPFKRYNRKKYVDNNDKSHTVVGYEHFALFWIESHYSEIQYICTNPGKLPRITYYRKDRKHKYVPDIYFRTKKGRYLFEIKSIYTLQANYKIDRLKFKAARRFCQKNNIKFYVLVVIENKKEKRNLFFLCENPELSSRLRETKSQI